MCGLVENRVESLLLTKYIIMSRKATVEPIECIVPPTSSPEAMQTKRKDSVSGVAVNFASRAAALVIFLFDFFHFW